MEKRRIFLLLASAALLLSCNEPVDQAGMCGNNVFDASEACEYVDNVVQFADGVRVCADGLGLVDIAKFECNACAAVAGVGACAKKTETCGNNVLDAGESCDAVDAAVKFADGVRVCPDGLALVDIAKFECNACVAVAGLGACVKEAQTCGNNVLDAGESCDTVDAAAQFADGTRICADGLELSDLAKFECNACVAVAGVGACIKEVIPCGNNVLDTDDLCDLVDGIVRFADGARVCVDGLELDNIEKFDCSSDCQPSALDGACKVKISCGNKILDAKEVCDIDGAGISLFASGAQKCADGFAIADVNKIVCKSDCTVDASACEPIPRCGDNTKNGDEVCDHLDFGDKTCASILGAGATGKLTCATDCKGLDSSDCRLCGNGIIEGDELCDKTNLQDKTCADFGGVVGVGALVCNASCLIDSSACRPCVDDKRECIGGSLKLCVAGKWTEASDSNCANGYICNEGEVACTKHPKYCDTGKCEGNKQYACVKKILQEGVACSSFQECKTGFYTCQNNSKYCEEPKCGKFGNEFEACIENQLQDPVACAAGYECFFYDEPCVKKINYCNTDKCAVETSGPNKDKALFRVCTDHEWGASVECPGGASCKDALSCGVCKDGNTKCEGKFHNTCSMGQWGSATDCGALGQICDPSAGCVAAMACGNGSVEGQEICDASNALHMLSGAGTLCYAYDNQRYSNVANTKVKCSAQCTIDDSACTHNTRVAMGMCRFEALSNSEVKISYTAETGSVAGSYQFRLACSKVMGTSMKFWTDIRKTFDIFTVVPKNNELGHATYTIDVSSMASGAYYCAMQYRRGSSLNPGDWLNYETELCSAKPGLKGQITTSVSNDDLLILTIP